MKIASVTLTSNRSPVIGDAIRSVVDLVDKCVVVDMGVSDDTIEVVRSIAGEKMVVIPMTEIGRDLAYVRTMGVNAAGALGMDWALMVDTDERIHAPAWGDTVVDQLSDPDLKVLLAAEDQGRYTKERFIRCNAGISYVSVNGTHECIVPENGQWPVIKGLTFTELAKTPEQLKKKLDELEGILSQQVKDNPKDSRAWYYLGDTLEGLGKQDEAIHAFDKCASLRGWDEESAWACFRMAILFARKGRFPAVLDICAAGLTRHAGMVELCWLAGDASLRMGQPDKAIYWERMAVANSEFNGKDPLVRPRIGFRFPAAMREGPYLVMAEAYKTLGMKHEANAARRMAKQVKEAQDVPR